MEFCVRPTGGVTVVTALLTAVTVAVDHSSDSLEPCGVLQWKLGFLKLSTVPKSSILLPCGGLQGPTGGLSVSESWEGFQRRHSDLQLEVCTVHTSAQCTLHK